MPVQLYGALAVLSRILAPNRTKVPFYKNSSRLSEDANPRETSTLRSLFDEPLLPGCRDVMHVPQYQFQAPHQENKQIQAKQLTESDRI